MSQNPSGRGRARPVAGAPISYAKVTRKEGEGAGAGVIKAAESIVSGGGKGKVEVGGGGNDNTIVVTGLAQISLGGGAEGGDSARAGAGLAQVPLSGGGDAGGRAVVRQGGGRGDAGATAIERRGGGGRGEFASDYVTTRPSLTFNKIGKTGNPVKLVANYFELQNHPDFHLTLYAVKVTPAVEEESKVQKLVRAQRDAIGPYVLSGFQMFTTMMIKDAALSFHAKVDGDDQLYHVVLDFKREVAVSEPLVFQFQNILVRQIQQGLQYELLGRHYFDPRQKVGFPQWNLELWPGFQNSIRQQERAQMLNVESVWKVIRTDTVLRIWNEIKKQERDVRARQEKFLKAVKGLVVITDYNSKGYKIDDVNFDTTPMSTFERTQMQSDGAAKPKLVPVTFAVSYAEYYQSRHQKKITDLQQPMLISRPTKRDIRRGQTGDIVLVPEFCHPTGLNDDLRKNYKLMGDLAKCLHMDPTKRVTTMNEFIASVNTKAELKNALKKWGVQISATPVEVTGRVLPQQDIVFADGKTSKGDDKADWTRDIGNRNKMLTSMPLESWAIIVTERNKANVQVFISNLQDAGESMGYRIAKPRVVGISNSNGDTYVNAINKTVEDFNGKMDMILFILANDNADTYAKIKRRVSMHFGIPSQCILSKNVRPGNKLRSICKKVVIQMNAKHGGEPWGVQVPMKDLMVLGYDVHHAGADGGCSAGAMTATVSSNLGRCYSTVAKIQSDRQEVSTEISGMFEKCLRAYARYNSGQLPKRIMMYRDGVGEGQLREVKETEVEGVKTRMGAIYKEMGQELAKLSYIIVSKRINTRLMQQSGAGGKTFTNPSPGLVVDDVVTRPERYDFFLVSQATRQGCVSPTYYNVIHDESGLSPDQIHIFTYRLCHIYYNSSGTVAVPAPCQNAHKLAFLGGTALKGPVAPSLQYLKHFL